MKIKKGFIKRKVAGEIVVVPIGKMAKSFNGMITLNDSSEFLWDFFLEEHTREEAVCALLDVYDVDRQRAEEGVNKFINILTENAIFE